MRSRYKIFGLILVLAYMIAIPAGPVPARTMELDDIGTVHLDDSPVRARKAPRSRLEEYRKQDRFNYQETKEDNYLTELFRRLKEWLNAIRIKYFKKWNLRNPLDLRWFQVMLIIFCVIGAVYLAFKLARVDIFYRKKRLRGGQAVNEITDLDTIDFDGLIGKHLANGEYRLAVRLLYHRALKALADRGMINWKIEKTNDDYVRELKKPEIRYTFVELTRLFEYIWYGNFPIDSENYRLVSGAFEEFSRMVP